MTSSGPALWDRVGRVCMGVQEVFWATSASVLELIELLSLELVTGLDPKVTSDYLMRAGA